MTDPSAARQRVPAGRLYSRVAIVTGGGSGIGRAICHSFASQGAAVVIADRNADAADTVAGEVRELGARALPCVCDVAQDGAGETVVDKTVKSFGSIDILVNNAGYCEVKPLLEVTRGDLDRMIAVHLQGTLQFSQAAARRMIEQGRGRIINIVSGGGQGASAFTSHYQAAKAAQASLGRSFAEALRPHGITVNNVSPGLVLTPLWTSIDADYRRWFQKSSQSEIAERVASGASPRSMEPHEIADVVLFLALDSSSAINAQTITVEG